MRTKHLVWACVSLLAVILIAQPAIGGAKTEFSGTDQVVGYLSPGTVTNPDGNIHIRACMFQTRVTTSLFSGDMIVTINANWDSHFTGPVWGTFVVTLDNNAGTWEGTWTGTRTLMTGFWRTTLQAQGYGTGGQIDAMHLKLTEVADSTSPIPMYTATIQGYMF